MERIWNNFDLKKPMIEKEYVVITETTHNVTTLLYYPNSKKFNWDGNGEDTSIDVEFWAEKEDIYPFELKNKNLKKDEAIYLLFKAQEEEINKFFHIKK